MRRKPRSRKRRATLAAASQAAGNLPAAVAAWQKVYYGYPQSDEAKQAADELARLKERMGDAIPAVPGRN